MKSQGKTWCICFSPSYSTEKAARAVGKGISGCDVEFIDVSAPEIREQKFYFNSHDTVILAVPTYAGRVPNKIMPFFRDNLKGFMTRAVIVVTYGGRSYDDCLMEMILMSEENGFCIEAAATVPCEHAFAPTLTTGRPDEKDLDELEHLGTRIELKISNNLLGEKSDSGSPFCEKKSALERFSIPGNNPVGPYYTPKKPDGEPAVFLKAKPKTDLEKCVSCGFCWEKCPMGSIEPGAPANVSGVCIKCQRCVKFCPKGAKSFDNEDFLLHKQMLEESFAQNDRMDRKEIEIYL